MVERKLDLTITENTEDWEASDAAWSAESAVSGIRFEPHEKDGLEERIEFWEWWLTEAIPQAWELAEKGF